MMPKSTRTPTPTQPETADQRLIRAFEATMADVTRLVVHAHDTTMTDDIAGEVCARHTDLALDPDHMLRLVRATCAVFANLLARR
jgi:hypothetical protein